MKKHANIPIFIPHVGCPNTCVFCNQRTISGVMDFKLSDVEKQIDESLATLSDDCEAQIAFFGGSFTGIDRSLMIDLLEIANSYIKSGKVSSIRCSTRPDYINEEILVLLKKYGVSDIELGLQSICDDVLTCTKRNHTSNHSEQACRLIVSYGFNLVGQMMIGLPQSSLKKELETAGFIISAGAKAARIYPTLVLKGTELEDMARTGIYIPISLDEAVARSAAVFRLFIENGVDVIRIGLCASENLSSDETYFAGPNHPALGELVLNRYFFDKIVNTIPDNIPQNSILQVNVCPKSLSRAIGQNKINKAQLMKLFNFEDIRFVSDQTLDEYGISIKTIGGRKCI